MAKYLLAIKIAQDQIQRDLDSKLLDEETKWKQRSKFSWIKGDHNTKLFHNICNHRHRLSLINEIMINDVMVRDKNIIEQTIWQHFQQRLN